MGCVRFTFFLTAVMIAGKVEGATQQAVEVPPSNSQLVELTDTGLLPHTLRMKQEDGLLFFLNRTKNSLATIELNFNGKQKHCASAGLDITDEGNIRSTRPLSPRDFVSVCFPERGEYGLKVWQGDSHAAKPLTAKIVIE